MSGFQKEIVPPPQPPPEAISLKRTISFLTVLYLILFVTSLAIIVRNNTELHPRGDWGTWAWAVLLGSAVCTRLFRQTLVRKYNSIIAGGRPTPIQ